jgi:REP element-mobilizing transposase RayT
MTAPRQVLPGATYLVTRRCSERRFFLRPSAQTNAIFAYVLAVAAARYRVRVHAYCVLSNHFHLVVTDPEARLPDFHRHLDGLVARAMNCALGRWESFWDPDSYSAVRLESNAAVFEKIVYVLANPVLAGLVRRAREWPGLWSDPNQIGRSPSTVERPSGFFREGGPMPAAAELQLESPPGYESDETFLDDLSQALREMEDRAAADRAREGRAFIGRGAVLGQPPGNRPHSTEPRRGLVPRVACRNKWKRIEALSRLLDFGREYREALAAWKAGARAVIFPAGTWLMRVQHGAYCAAPG